MVIIDICSWMNLVILYFIFLSFKVVGREFWALQFDNLLLEMNVISLLLYFPSFPYLFQWKPFSSLYFYYSHFIIWCYLWLLFRLHFCSGVLKLIVGDKVWRDGTAL